MTDITIRTAVEADCPVILRLVRELARFEDLLDTVRASEADLRRDGFGPQPRFECLLAEAPGPDGAEALGFALYFHSYSTFAGRAGLFLEDIFVLESARGLGVGRRLLTRLAAIAAARDCARLELSVLDWNPARRFYERHGFRQTRDWLPYRLTGTALAALAEQDNGGLGS